MLSFLHHAWISEVFVARALVSCRQHQGEAPGCVFDRASKLFLRPQTHRLRPRWWSCSNMLVAASVTWQLCSESSVPACKGRLACQDLLCSFPPLQVDGETLQASAMLTVKTASGATAQGRIEAEHLADHPAAARELREAVAVGARLGPLLVLDRLEVQPRSCMPLCRAFLLDDPCKDTQPKWCRG